MKRLYEKFMSLVNNERGAQSLEWLGLAALLIMVLAIISTAVQGGSGTIGDIIDSILQNIQGMVGG
jgi:Flp pilus assembly pilin Flp